VSSPAFAATADVVTTPAVPVVLGVFLPYFTSAMLTALASGKWQLNRFEAFFMLEHDVCAVES